MAQRPIKLARRIVTGGERGSRRQLSGSSSLGSSGGMRTEKGRGGEERATMRAEEVERWRGGEEGESSTSFMAHCGCGNQTSAQTNAPLLSHFWIKRGFFCFLTSRNSTAVQAVASVNSLNPGPLRDTWVMPGRARSHTTCSP